MASEVAAAAPAPERQAPPPFCDLNAGLTKPAVERWRGRKVFMALRAALLCLALPALALLWALSRPARPERAAVARPATPVPPDLFPIASDARLGGDPGRTRLVFDLSRPIEIAAFTLADPYRVVIDLPQITFQLPARTGEQGRGLVKAFRYGLVMQGGSRIVVDATGPVRIDKAFVLESVDGQPARLVLDLVATDRASFMRTLALEGKPRRAPETKPAEVAKRPNDGRPLIVIDPGHGGPDTGTIASSGEMEKVIVLEFAQSALREAREEREVSGHHDAKRRSLRAARRTRAHGARAGCRAAHLDSCGCARQAPRGRCARRDGLHGVGYRLGR